MPSTHLPRIEIDYCQSMTQVLNYSPCSDSRNVFNILHSLLQNRIQTANKKEQQTEFN